MPLQLVDHSASGRLVAQQHNVSYSQRDLATRNAEYIHYWKTDFDYKNIPSLGNGLEAYIKSMPAITTLPLAFRVRLTFL